MLQPMPMGLPLARSSLTMLIVLVLAGCTAFERGAEQGDPPTDPITGCPDLSGSYALRPTTPDGDPDPGVDPEKPSRLDDVFSPRGGQGYGAGELAQYEGVVVRS